MTTVTIIPGDAALKLSELASESIHMGLTSPPYDRLRTYGGDAPFDFPAVAAELYRVLAPGGVLCWNVGDEVVNGSETLTSMRQALHFVDVVGFRMHDTMIYEKTNFSHPERVRYHQLFEYVFVLSKGAPRAFNPIKDKPNVTAGKIGSLGANTFTHRDGSKGERPRKVNAEFGMRSNIWRGKTRGQEQMCEALPHPAMMPRWLARDLILSWSNEGDTVIDPFAGSGTTGFECLRAGREAVLIEISPAYCHGIRAALTHQENDL